MTVSLVTLGPGGVYTTRYIPRGSRLLATSAADEDSQQPADQGSNEQGLDSYNSGEFCQERTQTGPRTLLDRILRIDRVTISKEAEQLSCVTVTTSSIPISMRVVALHQIARSWLSGQLMVLEQLRNLFERLQLQSALGGVGANAIPASTFDALQRFAAVDAEENSNELNSQAIENTSTDKRLSSRSRLFADDAGTCKRTISQQSNHFRARRSTYKKGRLAARSQQGSLFINL